ncbi:acylneuraminate cytidylyltransferase family protein [Mesorhizobium sp. A623]
MKTLAVIPARGGSKRLPGKNIKPFLGVPLIAWSIRFARQVPRFDGLVVSTDDEAIAAVCRAEGVDVPHLRPANLATDTASTLDVVLDALEREAMAGRHYDTVALLQPTSPMREPSRWAEAFAMLETPACDAVVGVAPVRTHPYLTFQLDGARQLVPFHDRSGLKLRSQDMPAAVFVAGNLYLIGAATLRSEQTFFPLNTFGMLCDKPFEAVDIDDELDWLMAETIAARYGAMP